LFQYDPNIWMSLKGLCLIFILEARLLLLYTCLYLFAHSHILLATLWIIALKIFRIRLDKIGKAPSRRKLTHISHYLNSFRMKFTRTLLTILNANRLFSKVIVVFLGVNCPLNCLLVCLLTVGRIPKEKIVFVGPVSMEGFVFIFGIHMAVASVNKHIHSPSKQFIRLNLSNKCCKLKFRIRMDNFIHSFHTRRKYGFTYYSVG